MSTIQYRRETLAERTHRFYDSMQSLGFTWEESNTLRRVQLTLHRWAEQECGDSNDFTSWSIERDETTNVPYRCVYPHNGRSYRTRIADRETGAIKRAKAVVAARNARHADGWQAVGGPIQVYHQGDCRGCSLYLVRAADVPAGASIDSCYNRGFAVCV